MFTTVIDLLGDDLASLLGGLLVGDLFGFFAQRSRFCLRAATIEFSRGQGGPRLAVWLLTFAAALVGTQAIVAAGLLDVSEARQLAQQGSISGAMIGGLMFGCRHGFGARLREPAAGAVRQRQSEGAAVGAGLRGDGAVRLSWTALAGTGMADQIFGWSTAVPRATS